MCVSKNGRGKRQAVDSVFIKANASMDSLVERSFRRRQCFCKRTRRKQRIQSNYHRKKLVERHHDWKAEAYKGMPANSNSRQIDENGNLIRPKYLSNHTHYSPTDSDARVEVKPRQSATIKLFWTNRS